MEICICDDEKKLRNDLKSAVETELQLNGISCAIKEFSSGEALLCSLGASEPDILFLDIEFHPGRRSFVLSGLQSRISSSWILK